MQQLLKTLRLSTVHPASMESTADPAVEVTSGEPEAGAQAPEGVSQNLKAEAPQPASTTSPTPTHAETAEKKSHTTVKSDGRVLIPTLRDLVIKQLAENYNVYPAIDDIPIEYVDSVVDLLDPKKIAIETAAKYIQNEKFWERLSSQRFPLAQRIQHGGSWKRLYIENHVQDMIISYHPSDDHAKLNLERLLDMVDVLQSWVFRLSLDQIGSDLSMHEVLGSFPNLFYLRVTKSARNVGMDYKKELFGLRKAGVDDVLSFVRVSRSLSQLSLRENLIDDNLCIHLARGLVSNHSLTLLDLSHNRIGDKGAKALAEILKPNCTLTSLDLTHNEIAEQGAKALASYLETNQFIEELSLRMNNIGDIGGHDILKALNENCGLRKLNLSGNEMKESAGRQLLSAVRGNSTLGVLDVSNNQLSSGLGEGRSLTTALEKNVSLYSVDIRRNGLATECEEQIKAHVRKIYGQHKQQRRRRMQELGWDNAQ